MKKTLLFFFLFLISLCSSATVPGINPDSGFRGQHLNTTITLNAGFLSVGSGPVGTSDIFLQQGSTVIYADPGYSVFMGMDSAWVTFSIPSNAPLGLYDVHFYNSYYDPFNGWMHSDDPNYGAFTVKGDAGTIEGEVYFDANQNGVRDINEQPLSNHRIQVSPSNAISLTDQNGHFGMAVDTGTYTISYLPAFSYNQTSMPTTYSVTVPPSQTALDFGAYSAQSLYKQELLLTHSAMRCFSYTYISFYLRNNGNDTAFGSMSFNHSPNLSFYSASPSPDLSSGMTYIWNYNNLAPGQIFTASVIVGNPAAGQLVWYSVIDSLRDNSGNLLTMYADSFATVTRCSMDPNEKLVYPFRTATGNPTPMDNQLNYTINFQNTGNDTALTVTIYDTLDSNLDLNTLEIVGSSDPVITQYTPSGAMRFTFNNIMLPDSTTDEPGSHGFVQYRIRPLASLPDPTVVTNTSYIVFDYNEPVVTNTAINTFTNQQPPSSIFSSPSPVICANTCINFVSIPQTGTTYQWLFPGGSPSSSTDPNPSICYVNSGSYDVTLITTNSLGSDTLTQQQYINVNSSPTLAVSQVGDSLIGTSGYTSYQWYYFSNPISGATSSSYLATQDGDYTLVATNANGCQSSVNLLNVVTDIAGIGSSVEEIAIFPNPSSGSFKVAFKSFGNIEAKLDLLNAVGSIVYSFDEVTTKGVNTINVEHIATGVYTLRLQLGQKLIHQKIIIHD